MQILERAAPTQPAERGKPIKRENEYKRHGTRVFIGSFVVTTGQIIGDLGLTRGNLDFRNHVRHVVGEFPNQAGFDWVVDNLNTHWSLDLCEFVAQWCDLPFGPKALRAGPARRAFLTDPTHALRFHFVPKHGSWLNHIKLWFAVLRRQFLADDEFSSPQEYETAFWNYINEYNNVRAHPYRWTYTGQPLQRATPFSQTRRQAQHGQAFVHPRPQPFERLLYPPRPNRKKPSNTPPPCPCGETCETVISAGIVDHRNVE